MAGTPEREVVVSMGPGWDNIGRALLVAKNWGYRSGIPLETSYGLLVDYPSDSALHVRLKKGRPDVPGEDGEENDGAPAVPEPPPDPNVRRGSAVSRLGYMYVIKTDREPTFIRYEPGWAGNPDDEYLIVMEDLEKKYPNYWCRAYQKWEESYEECVNGPDKEKRKHWLVDGIMLACWLALQPGVYKVDYQPEGEMYEVRRETVSGTVRRFLEEVTTM